MLDPPEVNLLAPCKIGEGIIQVSPDMAAQLRQDFVSSAEKKAFFIPASGSGSRMFEFLFRFVKHPTQENRGEVERFLNHVQDFAFFHQFPANVQQQLLSGEMSLDGFVAYILNNDGKGLAHLPKGLIPFHRQGPFILNPFHEHILQGLEITGNTGTFHFTIRKAFEDMISQRLEEMKGMTGKSVDVVFSEQNCETDSFAFDENDELMLDEEGEAVRRPAGHGALIENLNAVDADVIFIKNIDNVQHYNLSGTAIGTQQALGGLLLAAQTEIFGLVRNFNRDHLKDLNSRYQLFHPEELNKPDEELLALLKRPIRVCGMVRNEGQPGGGPFWIKENGGIRKQIVEKAQISSTGDQFRLMVQSTHFNPVMLVCSTVLHNGQKVDFPAYVDDSKYFVVHKNHEGHDIRFVELPGLWNGSMANWNSIFVEIPSETFSPVKNILDLLEPAHRG